MIRNLPATLGRGRPGIDPQQYSRAVGSDGWGGFHLFTELDVCIAVDSCIEG